MLKTYRFIMPFIDIHTIISVISNTGGWHSRGLNHYTKFLSTSWRTVYAQVDPVSPIWPNDPCVRHAPLGKTRASPKHGGKGGGIKKGGETNSPSPPTYSFTTFSKENSSPSKGVGRGWQELFQRSVTVNFNSINGRESHWRGRSRGGGALFPPEAREGGKGGKGKRIESTRSKSIHSLFSSGFQPGACDLPTPLSLSLTHSLTLFPHPPREKSFS